jgi:ribose 5-phosphate isomerase B
MRIAVGSDHAGFEDPPPHYKPALMDHVTSLGHEVVDCGTNGPDSVDYPDFAGNVCKAVLEGRADRGILVCGTGIGVGIAANRYEGIRAATCATPDMACYSRTHNDANVICLGRRILTLEECTQLVDIFLETEFSQGERHARRIAKMG